MVWQPVSEYRAHCNGCLNGSNAAAQQARFEELLQSEDFHTTPCRLQAEAQVIQFCLRLLF